MAYMSQERKASLAPAVKSLLKEYGLRGSLSVHHHSSLDLTIKSGSLDFMKSRINRNGEPVCQDATHDSVNTYHIATFYSGQAREYLMRLRDAMMVGNHDNSDISTDYFDVGWYVRINIGKWDKPYIYEGGSK